MHPSLKTKINGVRRIEMVLVNTKLPKQNLYGAGQNKGPRPNLDDTRQTLDSTSQIYVIFEDNTSQIYV